MQHFVKKGRGPFLFKKEPRAVGVWSFFASYLTNYVLIMEIYAVLKQHSVYAFHNTAATPPLRCKVHFIYWLSAQLKKIKCLPGRGKKTTAVLR